MRAWGSTAVLVIGLVLAGGASSAAPAGSVPANDKTAMFEFTGRVVYQSLEGGFWGIVSDDNRHYDPGPLAEEFHHDGLPVIVRARRLPGSISFHMWGERIEIVTIRRRDAAGPKPESERDAPAQAR
jgi:hypothetical protein